MRFSSVFIRFVAAAPAFAVAAVLVANLLDKETSLNDMVHKNFWYFFTAVSSSCVGVFHIYLFVKGLISPDTSIGWWYWRFPNAKIDEKKQRIHFWTYDYAWAYAWVVFLIVELSLPVDRRANDIEITLVVTSLYVVQTLTCVPVLYAAYRDWKIGRELHPDVATKKGWFGLLQLGSLGRLAAKFVV